MIPIARVCTRYYLRVVALDRPGVIAQITQALGDCGISLASVIQKERVAEPSDSRPAQAEIVLMTHLATEAAVQQAVAQIARLPVVERVGSLIRVEG
jgi:homoserine dehydrogenase